LAGSNQDLLYSKKKTVFTGINM